ncbi:hypothetical protein KKHFBJBL_01991 [Brevundimonas sp. NIBR11]|nr:hypothetical protein KKHFBJBL_01991 [Brevundimonas sp. NIBR11]
MSAQPMPVISMESPVSTSARLLLLGATAVALAAAAAPASACGGFPFSHGPGLGTTSTSNRSLDVGDIVTATFNNPGTDTLRIFKSAPAPVVDLLPTTAGPGAGTRTYTATATSANYTFSATKQGGDGQFATITYTCAAAPAPVPTLSEWSMILMGLLLAAGSALYIQRRQSLV